MSAIWTPSNGVRFARPGYCSSVYSRLLWRHPPSLLEKTARRSSQPASVGRRNRRLLIDAATV
jgi:hypothetical protein